VTMASWSPDVNDMRDVCERCYCNAREGLTSQSSRPYLEMKSCNEVEAELSDLMTHVSLINLLFELTRDVSINGYQYQMIIS